MTNTITSEEFATRFLKLGYDVDPYEYGDCISNDEDYDREHSQIVNDITTGNDEYIAEWLRDVIEEEGYDDAENLAEAKALMSILTA